MTPVRAEDRVGFVEMGAHARRDGFLSDVGVARAVDEPSLVAAHEVLLRTADDEHRSKERELGVATR